MKKTAVLNAQLSGVIASLGHTDGLTICDAGLPIPSEQQCVDLALTKGIPSFLSTLEVVLTELFVERILLAEEIKQANPTIEQQLLEMINKLAQTQGRQIEIEYGYIVNLNNAVIKRKRWCVQVNVRHMRMLFFTQVYRSRARKI